MRLLIKWLILTLAILIAAHFVPGAMISGFWPSFWLAAFLGVTNILLKPILIILTLPINILTLGLFTFVINAVIILLAASIVKGFSISGFGSALLFGIVLSIVSYLLNTIFLTKK